MKKGILIKYGEIVLKGNNRAQFENRLIKDIKVGLKDVVSSVNVTKEQGRFYMEAPSEGTEEWMEAVIDVLQRVFGIIGICPVDVLENDDIDTICDGMIEYVKREFDEPHTFKVFAKRTNKQYPMDSMAIAAEIGSRLLDVLPDWTVDVHNPEIKLYAELRNRVYVYGKEIKGPGGLPVGTGGKGTLLLSGGIDSPVAGWMMAKRGVHIAAIHYVSPPYTSDRAQLKVEQLCEKLTDWCGGIAFYCVPFTELQEAIKDHCPEEFFTIIMRRLMMEIAQRIAEKDNCLALITGESVGQVASQTMAAIACTDAVCRIPVFRPLVGMDKTEIIEISRKIDTFETSTLPYEDCCTVFTPRHPKVRPRLEDIEKAQNSFDFEPLIQRAVEGTTMKTFNYGK